MNLLTGGLLVRVQPEDPLTAPRCGATTRHGTPCQCPALRGRRRCRLHGGHSTGPRTSEGIARIRAAKTRDGRFSAEARALERLCRDHVARVRNVFKTVQDPHVRTHLLQRAGNVPEPPSRNYATWLEPKCNKLTSPGVEMTAPSLTSCALTAWVDSLEQCDFRIMPRVQTRIAPWWPLWRPATCQ